MYQIVNSFDGSECVRHVGDDGIVLLIPLDPANTDYQRYLAWVAAGGVPEIIEP